MFDYVKAALVALLTGAYESAKDGVAKAYKYIAAGLSVVVGTAFILLELTISVWVTLVVLSAVASATTTVAGKIYSLVSSDSEADEADETDDTITVDVSNDGPSPDADGDEAAATAD